jgi:hypothetical protein
MSAEHGDNECFTSDCESSDNPSDPTFRNTKATYKDKKLKSRLKRLEELLTKADDVNRVAYPTKVSR